MRIWICVVSLLCWVNVACAQAPAEYPNVPLSDPAYADINLLASQGVHERCFGTTYHGPRHMTRMEFAVAIARVCQLRSALTEDPRNGTVIYEGLVQGALSKTENSQERAALARLVVQFAPELQPLGITREQIEFAQKQLAASRLGPSAPVVSAPFADVPKTHWAFNAVESLRQSGIIIGYPVNTSAK